VFIFTRRDVNYQAGCHKRFKTRDRRDTNLGDHFRPLKSLRGLSKRSPYARYSTMYSEGEQKISSLVVPVD
jgi:hypothetical protein